MENKYQKIHRNKKQIFANNFIGGIAWGLGVTIGLSLFLAFLAFVANRIDFVPIIGEFTSNVINYVLENSGQIPGDKLEF